MKSGLFFLILLFLFLMPSNASAERAQIVVGGDQGWAISADTISGDRKAGTMEAQGNVVLIRGEDRLEADRLRLHETSRVAEVSGHVVFTTAEFELKCERFAFNLDNNVGKIYAGRIFFPSNNYYISGDEIEKTGPDDFVLTKGTITTCEGASPAWKLTAQNIKVRREGYASASHTTLSTRYFPFFYTPFVVVPVKTKRQSGFLIPELRTSARDGFSVLLPYFWAMSDSKDMTFYLTHMASRGLNAGMEFRYREWGGKGVYKFDFLEDKNPPITSGPGLDEEKNSQRFWVRGMSDYTSEHGFDIKVDIDMPSDVKLLTEFERNTNWFLDNNKQFLSEFGRSLNDARDPYRGAVFQASKFLDPMNMTMTIEVNDNLDSEVNEETAQRLPSVDLNLPWTGLNGTPLYFNMDANYTYFTRREGDRGHRWDIHPRLHWPADFFNWLNVSPSLGLRETAYHLDNLATALDGPAFRNREMIDFNFEVSTKLSRIYDSDFGRVEKIKHRLKPEIIYKYTSEEFRDVLPYFDQTDQIDREEYVEYGLGNYFVAKVLQKPKENNQGQDKGGEESSAPEYTYFEFLRFRISRTYNLLADQRWYPSDGVNNRENGPWVADYYFAISPYLSLDGTSEYDTYERRYTRHTADILVKDQRGDEAELNYTFHREDEIREISSRFLLALNKKTEFEFENRYSLEQNRNIETLYRMAYKAQCWTVKLEYLDNLSEQSLAVVFTLTGLGELGSHTPIAGSR